MPDLVTNFFVVLLSPCPEAQMIQIILRSCWDKVNEINPLGSSVPFESTPWSMSLLNKIQSGSLPGLLRGILCNHRQFSCNSFHSPCKVYLEVYLYFLSWLFLFAFFFEWEGTFCFKMVGLSVCVYVNVFWFILVLVCFVIALCFHKPAIFKRNPLISIISLFSSYLFWLYSHSL